MTGGIEFYPVKKVSYDFFDGMKRGHLQDLDVLINKDGANTGKSAIYRNSPYEKACINEHLFILRGLGGHLNQIYLHYLLQSLGVRKTLETKITGSAQPGLNSSFCQNFPIEILPLPEQKKIASILTSVDEVIENTQKQIDKLQDLKKATMNELLTNGIGHTEFKDSELGRIPKSWERQNLGKLGKFSTSSVDKKTSSQEDIVNLLNYMDVYKNSRLDENFPFQKVTAPAKQIESSSVVNGDVFFTPSSETPDDIGHSAVFIGNMSNIVHSYHTIRFRPYSSETFDDEFKAYAFKSESTYQYFRQRATGSTRFTVSLPVFENLEVSIPPLLEQKKIVSILSSIDKDIETKYRKLQEIQSLKKALMQDLLTGKVRVKAN